MEAGLGEEVEAHVAVGFHPFVVTLGEDRADQADDGGAVGEMPTTSVRRRISLFSRSCGLFDQICRQSSRGKPVNASRSC